MAEPANSLQDAVSAAAVKLLEIATGEGDKITLADRIKAFEAVSAWAKVQLKPAEKDAPKANGKYRDLRSKFHAAGPRGRATPPADLRVVTDEGDPA